MRMLVLPLGCDSGLREVQGSRGLGKTSAMLVSYLDKDGPEALNFDACPFLLKTYQGRKVTDAASANIFYSRR